MNNENFKRAQDPGARNQGKFCSYCGFEVHINNQFCSNCGKELTIPHQNNQYQGTFASPPQPGYQGQNFANPPYQGQASQPIIINNTNTNTNINRAGNAKNKWVALLLCLFFGVIGIHKFYEGKAGMGVLYIFTLGLFGIGVVVDFLVILFKPSTYYV